MISRRRTVQTLVAAGLGSMVRGADEKRNLIAVENARPGTRDWLLTNPRIDPATKYRCPWIEGYCSRTSVRAGELIAFHVSTNPPSAFTIEIFRLGFYGGDGGRLVHRFAPFEGRTQPETLMSSTRQTM